MTRTRVVIQSRLSSSRLPGKALMTIAGMPLIELVARRAARSGHEVVVATSSELYDERIAHHCERAGFAVVRGSLDDVLSRFVLATQDLDPQDLVVRLTGDNPVADADLVDELIDATRASGHTYGRVDIDQVPEGLGAEVFTAQALRLAHATTHDAYDREHVTPWLRREFGELLFVPQASPPDVHAYRATVDTLHDLVRVSTLFDGVEDPVGTPWSHLMASLVERVDALGPRVPAGTTGPYSAVVLSARRFADHRGLPRAEHAESLRALVAEALDRGVTHVEVGGTEGRAVELLRACLDPAVTQRLAVVLRVGQAAPAVEPPSDSLSAAIERDLARLGRRQVDTLVLDTVDEGAWQVARSYRDAGVVTRLGLLAAGPDDLRRAAGLDDLAWVEVPSDLPADDPALAAIRERGVVVAVDPASGPLPAWSTVRLLTASDRSDIDAAVRDAAGRGVDGLPSLSAG